MLALTVGCAVALLQPIGQRSLQQAHAAAAPPCIAATPQPRHAATACVAEAIAASLSAAVRSSPAGTSSKPRTPLAAGTRAADSDVNGRCTTLANASRRIQ